MQVLFLCKILRINATKAISHPEQSTAHRHPERSDILY